MSLTAEAKAFVNQIAAMDFADLSQVEATWLVEMQYQGFDYFKVVEAFFARAKLAKATLNMEPAAVLKKLCIFFVARGASIADSVLNKMKPEESTAMKKIINALQIVNKKPEKSDDLTISRIVSCFPHKVAQMLAALKDTNYVRIVGYDKLDAETKKLVPKYLCFPQAAALFPDTDEFKNDYAAWCIWLEAFSKIIVTREDKKASEEGKTKQSATFYANLAREAAKTIWTNDARKNTINGLKTITGVVVGDKLGKKEEEKGIRIA